MKRVLLATVALAAFTQPALAATSGSYLSIHHEERHGNRASGISFTTYNRGLAIGVSANRISSKKPLEMQNRTTIYPVYAFANLALRMPLAPYVEFGIDVADYLMSESANEANNNQGDDQPALKDVDMYGAIGLKTSLHRAPIDFAVYVKSYSLYFNDPYKLNGQQATNTVITMTGANVIFNF